VTSRPSACRLDRRLDDVDLLAAQASVLAGMRVQPTHRKARLFQAKKAAEVSCRGLDGGEDQLLGQRERHLLQWDVNGDRNDLEGPRGEHHHRQQRVPVARGESGEILGMSGKGEAGAIEH
jgi:hypothetical protein